MKFIEQKRTHIPAKTDFIQRKFLDLQYAPGNERRQLDIYLPNGGDGPYPVIIDIFGGGWYFGNKSSHKLEPALEMLRRGFAVVSINYSLSWQARFPTQVYEVKSAICFVRANADQYHLDGNRIALLGESAGAQLAALTALSAGCGKLENPEWPNYNVSNEVQAVAALYCPSNFEMTKEQFKVLGIMPMQEEFGEADSMEGVLFGWHKAKTVPDLVRTANPCNYVTGNCPPFLFLHGDQDNCVPVLQSMNLAAKIMYAADLDRVEYHLIPGARHDIHDFEREDIYDIEETFFKKYIGG